MREKISTTGPTQDTAAATDTTNLQSAWSAAMPDYYAGVMETRAPTAFSDCIQQYIYARKLRAPIPGKEPGVTNPLMDLWFDTNSLDVPITVIPYATSKMHLRADEHALFSAFSDDIKHDQRNYASWLAFQLSELVSIEYVSRMLVGRQGPIEPILHARELIQKENRGELSPENLLSFSGIELGKWHSEKCKTTFKSDICLYAVSYAYSLYRRGRDYGLKLSEHAYTPHWSRITANFLPGIDQAETVDNPERDLAHWGRIIYALIDEGFVKRNTHSIIDLIRTVRKCVQSGNFDLRKQAKSDQVVMLEEARVFARQTTSAELLAFINHIDKAIGFFGVTPIASVTSILDSPVVQVPSAVITRKYMWDSFGKRFYLPGVIGDRPQNSVAAPTSLDPGHTPSKAGRKTL